MAKTTSSASDLKQTARASKQGPTKAAAPPVEPAVAETAPVEPAVAETTSIVVSTETAPSPDIASSPEACAAAVTDVVVAKLADLSDRLANAVSTCKDAQVVIKGLQKDFARLCKAHNASIASARKRGGRVGAAGGGAGGGTPRKIALGRVSDEMAVFLGRNVADMVTRRDVIQGLNKYIKENKLQSPEDGRIILPDERLKDLLKIESDVKLNYFNMQRYINPHFTAIKGEQTAQTLHTQSVANVTVISSDAPPANGTPHAVESAIAV
jgi:hypothetical protein